MKAVLYPEFDTMTVTDRPDPVCAADEVILKVHACGICGSEIESFKSRSPRRPPPLIFGHEFCGEIVETGSAVAGFSRGRKVVSNSLVNCGSCVRCRRGDTHLCAARQVFGMHRMGAFAQYVNVPARVLLDWPENLTSAEACLAEPLGNGVHIYEMTRAYRPQTVLVIGAGPIGLMCLHAMRQLGGATVYVADLSPERLAVAGRMGAIGTFNPREQDLVVEILARTGGEGVDLVIDAVGGVATKKQSLAAARPGGCAVWIGLHQNEMTFNSFDVTLPERMVLGTYAARIEDLQKSLDLMASGKIDVRSWVKTFPISEGDTAFARMVAAKGDDIKGVILPNV